MKAFFIDGEMNEIGIPLDGIEVKIVPGFEGGLGFVVRLVFSISLKMGVGVNVLRVFADKLENVDFSATGSSYR